MTARKKKCPGQSGTGASSQNSKDYCQEECIKEWPPDAIHAYRLGYRVKFQKFPKKRKVKKTKRTTKAFWRKGSKAA